MDNLKFQINDYNKFNIIANEKFGRYAYSIKDKKNNPTEVPLYKLRVYYDSKNYIVDESRERATFNFETNKLKIKKINDASSYEIIEVDKEKYAHFKTDEYEDEFEVYELESYESPNNFIVDIYSPYGLYKTLEKNIDLYNKDNKFFVLVYLKYAIPIEDDYKKPFDIYKIIEQEDTQDFVVDEIPFGLYNPETKEIQMDEANEKDEDVSETASLASEASAFTESLDTDRDRFKIAKFGDKRYAFLKDADRTQPIEIYALEEYNSPARFIVDKTKPVGIFDIEKKKVGIYKKKIKKETDREEFKIVKMSGTRYATRRDSDLTQPFEVYKLQSYKDPKTFIVEKDEPHGLLIIQEKKLKVYSKTQKLQNKIDRIRSILGERI